MAVLQKRRTGELSLGAALLALAAAISAAAEAPAKKIELSACILPDLKVQARCGVYLVRENPERADSREIPIHVAVVPAKHLTHGDPIVPLMGGPGEDAISNAAYFAERFDALLEHRDLLLVDQRGTGRSGALHCDLYSKAHPEISLKDVFPAAAAARCEVALSTRADLTQYGYSRFADDLENIRTALGYEPFNISAGSYGTRAAVVFLRTHPGSVRTAFLGSVVPIDIAQPLPMARTAQSALEQLFEACAKDAACHGAFPDLDSEFDAIERRLRAGVTVDLPERANKVPLSSGRVTEWIRSLLYRPRSAAAIPWYVHQAYLDNWSPIVGGILSDAQSVAEELSLGLLFAITCNEDIPFLDEHAVMEETRGTYLSDYRVRQQQAACKAWPRSRLPAGYHEPVHSSVPTLFVSGDTDGGTPLYFMEHVARGFSASVAVVAHGQGHTEWSDCVGRLYQRLVEDGSTRGLSQAICPPVPRPTFKTGP